MGPQFVEDICHLAGLADPWSLTPLSLVRVPHLDFSYFIAPRSWALWQPVPRGGVPRLEGRGGSSSDSDTEDSGRLGVLQDPRQGRLDPSMFFFFPCIPPPPPDSNPRYRGGRRVPYHCTRWRGTHTERFAVLPSPYLPRSPHRPPVLLCSEDLFLGLEPPDAAPSLP